MKTLPHHPIKKQGVAKLLFIITRIILVAKVVFILLVLNNCIVQIHGPLAGFDYFEIPGWLIVYELLIGPDLMGQNQFFIAAVFFASEEVRGNS